MKIQTYLLLIISSSGGSSVNQHGRNESHIIGLHLRGSLLLLLLLLLTLLLSGQSGEWRRRMRRWRHDELLLRRRLVRCLVVAEARSRLCVGRRERVQACARRCASG